MRLFALCNQWFANILKKVRKNKKQQSEWIGIALPPTSFSATILQTVYQYTPVFSSTAYQDDDNNVLFEVYALNDQKKNKRLIKKHYKVLSFLANLDDWQFASLEKPPKTPLSAFPVDDFCQALLNSLEDNARHSIMQSYTHIKQQQAFIAQSIFPMSLFETGTMVSYAQVATGKPGIDDDGGQSYCFKCQIDSKCYLLDCRYYIDPHDIHNECMFYVALLNDQRVPQRLETQAVFLYDFRQNRCVGVEKNCHHLKINRFIAELTIQVPNWRKIIKSQYQAIKTISQQSQINQHW